MNESEVRLTVDHPINGILFWDWDRLCWVREVDPGSYEHPDPCDCWYHFFAPLREDDGESPE